MGAYCVHMYKSSYKHKVACIISYVYVYFYAHKHSVACIQGGEDS